MLEILLWSMIIVILYSYAGYGIILFFYGRLAAIREGREDGAARSSFEPQVCLLVASFNEGPWIEKKIRNCLHLDYPPEKLSICWVTDGSDDNSVSLLKGHPRILHLHQAERRGKIAAVNRGMEYVDAEIVIFSDANSILSPQSVRIMIAHFQNPHVGCIAGEKRIQAQGQDEAASSGEGLYWRYESWIKKQESRIGSCMGAAGELFAIRRSLFNAVEEDTLIEDFVISMRIAMLGYTIDYCPQAYTAESASATIAEEFKRKTRIAAGNFQCLLRMPQLLNPVRHGLLAVQYISHKFLRSFIIPLLLAALLPINFSLLRESAFLPQYVYDALLALQILFYGLALIGKIFENRSVSSRIFFIPYYVVMMNVASIVGCYRYAAGKQSVKWEKALRKDGPC